MRTRKLAFALLAGLAAASVHAAEFKVGQIEIDDLWVRATAPGQPHGAGYMEIDNDAGTPDRLVAVRSEAAERVELHEVATEGGVARMRALEQGLPVPADGEVDLEPGGYHIMFMKLKAPFKEGATVPATLQFERAGEVQVQFKVRPLSYRGDDGHAGHGGHESMPGMKH